MFTYNVPDSLVIVGGRYIRASRVESIDSTPLEKPDGTQSVLVTMFSGKEHAFRLSKKDLDRFAKQVMGDLS